MEILGLLRFLPFLPAIILGVVAAGFALAALVLFLRALSFTSRGVRVQGRVVGHRDYRSRGRLMYSAVYEATVPDGRTLQCTSGVGTSWQSPPVGTPATLLYRPHDPERPLATLGFPRFILSTVFGGVAVVLAVPAIAIAGYCPNLKFSEG